MVKTNRQLKGRAYSRFRRSERRSSGVGSTLRTISRRIGENLGSVNSARWRRQTLASMVAGRAYFRKAALYRITLVGAEIGALNAQRLDRGGHSALAAHVNLHPKSDA